MAAPWTPWKAAPPDGTFWQPPQAAPGFMPPGRLTLLRVADAFGIDPRLILSARRDRPVARARQAIYLVLRDILGWSLPEIGRFVGGRDHTTVLSGCRAARRLILHDADFQLRWDHVVRGMAPGGLP